MHFSVLWNSKQKGFSTERSQKTCQWLAPWNLHCLQQFLSPPAIYAFLNKCSTSNQILATLEFVHFLLKFDIPEQFSGNIKRWPSCLTYSLVWNFFFITSLYSLEITPLLESFGCAPMNILSTGSSGPFYFLNYDQNNWLSGDTCTFFKIIFSP